MKKALLFGIAALSVLSSAALAEEGLKWTDEEWSAGIKKLDYTRQVLSGKKVEWFWGSVHPDCSPTDTEFKVTKEPEHGTVEFTPSTGFLSFPKDNPRSKCNEKRVRGTMVSYKSKDGYKGEDSFEFVEINSTGLALEITYHLKLR